MKIYKITNLVTGKIYIGQTKRTLEVRLKAHLYEARANKYTMYLHNSIRFHGPSNFNIELIEDCDEFSVHDRERYWIKTLNTMQPYGYNEHEGGKGGCLNPTPELRKKLSEAKKGKPTWNKGLSGSDLVKRSPETRKKMSIAKTEWHRKRREPVLFLGGTHTQED